MNIELADDADYIYGLLDPRTSLVAYVGASQNPYARVTQHMNDCYGGRKKVEWINELKSANLKPRLVILEQICPSDRHAKELFWINRYTSQGLTLVNSAVPVATTSGRLVMTCISIPAYLIEWAKGQPEGLSGMVRECIRRNYEARSGSPAERLAQPRTEG